MPASVPNSSADLAAQVASHAARADDLAGLLDGVGRSLVAAGSPVCRVGLRVAALSANHRRSILSWRPDRGVEAMVTGHGKAEQEEHDRSPIGAAVRDGRHRARWRLDRGEGCGEVRELASLRAAGCTDYLLDVVAFPPGTALGGFGLSHATDRAGGFADAEVAAIRGLLDVCGLAILRFALSHALKDLLGAYVGHRASGRVMEGEVRRGEGGLMPAAILLADLKGFTAAADREDPRRLVGWLDEHLDALGLGIEPNGGEILKFTGDGFIAVFPVEDRDAAPCRVCERALDAARTGLAANRALEERRRRAGEPALAADLALHYGEVVYGNIGTASRLDFTAIGRAVNEASRIETLCDATGRNLLMSDSFARRCSEGFLEIGTFGLRGVVTPRRLWTVARERSPTGSLPATSDRPHRVGRSVVAVNPVPSLTRAKPRRRSLGCSRPASLSGTSGRRGRRRSSGASP